MAPEMIQHESYGFGVDVWAAGVVLYTLFTSRFPWLHQDIEEENSMVCNTPLDLKGYDNLLSAEAKDLVRKMLTKRQADRPTIEQVLAHPWLQQP